MKFLAIFVLFAAILTASYAQEAEKDTPNLLFLDRQPKCSCFCFIRRARRRARRMCRINAGDCTLMRCRRRGRRGLKCCPNPEITPTPEPTPDPTPCMDVASISVEDKPMVTPEAEEESTSEPEPSMVACPPRTVLVHKLLVLNTCVSTKTYKVYVCAASKKVACDLVEDIADSLNQLFVRRNLMRMRAAMRILEGTLEGEDEISFSLVEEMLRA